MKVIKSRFDILPFDILEKIFNLNNLKVFETDDIDRIFYKSYYTNRVLDQLKNLVIVSFLSNENKIVVFWYDY